MAIAAGSRKAAQLEPLRCPPQASPSASSPDRPSLHGRERSSSMKNRKRETCTSGSVRDEDGNILIYSAEGRTFIFCHGIGEIEGADGLLLLNRRQQPSPAATLAHESPALGGFTARGHA